MKKPPANPDAMPTKDEMPVKLVYQVVGRCMFCLNEISALQPGGLDPVHTDTGIPSGECEQAKRAIARGLVP